MASPLVYAALGFLTGPVGGAVAGVLYANKSNELAALEGRASEKSPLLYAVVGVVLNSFAGAYFGYKLADTENALNAKVNPSSASSPERAAPASSPAASERTPVLQQEAAPDTWQQRIAESQDMAEERAR